MYSIELTEISGLKDVVSAPQLYYFVGDNGTSRSQRTIPKTTHVILRKIADICPPSLADSCPQPPMQNRLPAKSASARSTGSLSQGRFSLAQPLSHLQ